MAATCNPSTLEAETRNIQGKLASYPARIGSPKNPISMNKVDSDQEKCLMSTLGFHMHVHTNASTLTYTHM